MGVAGVDVKCFGPKEMAELEMQKLFPFNFRACSSCCRDDLNSQYGKGPMLRQSVLRDAIELNALDIACRCQRHHSRKFCVHKTFAASRECVEKALYLIFFLE